MKDRITIVATWIKKNLILIVLMGLLIALAYVITTIILLARSVPSDLKLLNRQLPITAKEDSTVTNELRKLRDKEVLIIYAFKNEEIKVKRISDDSLQYWADSLYNRAK